MVQHMVQCVFCMGPCSNMGKGHQHRPWLWQGYKPRHDPWPQLSQTSPWPPVAVQANLIWMALGTAQSSGTNMASDVRPDPQQLHSLLGNRGIYVIFNVQINNVNKGFSSNIYSFETYIVYLNRILCLWWFCHVAQTDHNSRSFWTILLWKLVFHCSLFVVGFLGSFFFLLRQGFSV